VAADVFLRQRNIEPRELYEHFGKMFAPGWADVRGDLEAVADHVALNMTSFGGTTEVIVGDRQATVTSTWRDDIDDPAWTTPVREPLVESWRGVWETVIPSLGLKFSSEDTPTGFEIHISE
jgi:hypothetical protein